VGMLEHYPSSSLLEIVGRDIKRIREGTEVLPLITAFPVLVEVSQFIAALGSTTRFKSASVLTAFDLNAGQGQARFPLPNRESCRCFAHEFWLHAGYFSWRGACLICLS